VAYVIPDRVKNFDYRAMAAELAPACPSLRNVFVLDGRKKDLINRGGEKISSEEVENHILAHPAVDHVCVVAMPDAVYGEKACAFVIPKPRKRLAFSELVAFLEGRRIARFKLPERLELVDAFPIRPAGDILRRALRTMVAAKLY
jgi:2,3-dihydroxybenzoate-AMP ligase